MSTAAPISIFLVSAALGVFAAVTKRRSMLAVFKPLTTLLLLPVVGWPHGTFAVLVVIGIAFSLGGDVALLSASQKAFLVGLALFLVAHVAYIVGFVGVARTGWADAAAPRAGWTGAVGAVAAVAVLMAGVTVGLLRRLGRGAGGMRGPLVGYAMALAAMVIGAFAALPGTGISAAAGAALFYVSDASLALDKFHRPIKFAPLLTLGLYWLGQLGIALAARAASAG